MEAGYMVSMRSTKGYASTKSPNKAFSTPTKSPDRQSRSTNSPSTPRFRRTLAPPTSRDPQSNAPRSSSSNNSNSGSCKGSDCSPTKGRHQKYTSCTDNHGIRPPPPEQYLTPLQQKEVCIRHLRARLKETITTLQNRDTEIDELRGKLYKMQEDWVEEECHRVEAQLALKEARQEIQQLKEAVDTVRASLSDAGALSGDVGVQKYFQDINCQNHKLENLLLSMELAEAGLTKEGGKVAGGRHRVGGSAPASVSGESPGGIPKTAVGGRGSCSCDGSPAHSLARSSTYTKLSDQALADKIGNETDFPCLSADGTQDSGFVCCGEGGVPSRADLLLEAAFLSEETTSLLNSYSQRFSQTLPSSLPHSYSHTLPRSFPHSFSHSMPHTMPHSSTYEKLCTDERFTPIRCGLGAVSCMSHPCLSHHHLYLHSLKEMGIQTESCPIPATGGFPSDLDTVAEQRTFRSQACSPTSTWMSDEGEEELDSISTTTSLTTATVMSTATEPIPVSKTLLLPSLPRSATVACSMESPPSVQKDDGESEEKQESMKREEEALCAKDTEQTPEHPTAAAAECGRSKDNDDEDVWKEENQSDFREVTETQTSPLPVEHCEERWLSESSLHNQNVMERQKELNMAIQSTHEETQKPKPHCLSSSPALEHPHTSQPRRSASSEEISDIVHEDQDKDEANEEGATADPSGAGPVEKSYWSRHFLVDLLAVAIPVVPTVAWLCRGPVRDGQPMYHIGSLLRGCCTVALHSLRRGGGLRHYPAGGGNLGGSQI
ncbi:syntaphilin isoform X3 [Gouania willdenowi]|nr:syntaphilin isoform X3 [Gouania willdenowi]XP_028309092.1 syntaphilin isoform X3 [Gouania willdenowi]